MQGTTYRVKFEQRIPWDELVGFGPAEDDDPACWTSADFEDHELIGTLEVGATVTVSIPTDHPMLPNEEAIINFLQGKQGVIVEIFPDATGRASE